MWTWTTFFLLLHVMTAIAVFGPTFAFPFISSFAQKDPRNALVVAEILHGVERKIVIPGAVAMPFFGLALIYLRKIDLWSSTWLLIAIPLYMVAFFFAAFVQDRNGAKMIELIRSMPPPPPGPPPGDAPAGGPGGPPPAIAAMAKKLQMGGMFLTILVVAIIVLMVWKPGAAFHP